ncbi:3415_t:CDS:2, partial [Entrophospora sp. SA101]
MSSQKHKPQLIAVGEKQTRVPPIHLNMNVQLELNETKFIIRAA